MKKIYGIISICMMLVLLPTISASTLNMKIDNGAFFYKGGEFVSGEIIVKFKNGVTNEEKNKINSGYDLSVLSSNKCAGFQRLKVPQGKTVLELVDILNKNPNVEYAEPNFIVYANMIPNDPSYTYQWHLHNVNEGGINMEPAWGISTGSGAVVAIVDSGIRVGSDLSGTNFIPGYDFVNNDNDPIDDNGHGTHVAGTVAQRTNNNIGVAGVAFGASLMPVKVLNSQGSGSLTALANGIYYAVDHGANIISMSIESSSGSQTLQDALAYAYNHGVTCIAASGNSGQNGVSYPAAYDAYVIAVGATQYDKTRAPYSNYGSSLDLMAPGGNTNLDQNGDGYGDGVLQQTFTLTGSTVSWGYYFFQGTSMATPHVSGVAALLYSKGITSPDNIRNILQSTAVDLGTTGKDIYFGYGLINAYAALSYNKPTVTTNDATSIGQTTATLNGNLGSLGGATSCEVWFEYGLTTSYVSSTNHQTKASTGSFSESISGLTCGGITYHFRAVAKNSAGTTYGVDKTFITTSCTTPPRTLTLRPNAAGVYNQHNHKNGAAGDVNNYQEVDEVTADDASTYIYDNINGDPDDQYNIPNHGTESGAIISVTVFVRARGSGSQTQPSIYIGSTIYRGSWYGLTSSWQTVSYTWTTNPATGSAWTWSNIDSLQIGTRSRYNAQVTQVYAEIKY